MKRQRFYHSQNLPKLVFGFYSVCSEFDLIPKEEESTIHEKINTYVKNATKINITKYFDKYKLEIGKDIELIEDFILPFNCARSLSNNYQIQFKFKVVNPTKFLKNLKVKGRKNPTDPFIFAVDSWGDVVLSIDSVKAEGLMSPSLLKLEDKLNHNEIKSIIDLCDWVLSIVPQSFYSRIFCDTFYPKYQALKDKKDFYVVKSAITKDCQPLLQNKNDSSLNEYLSKLNNVKLLRKLKKELAQNNLPTKSFKI